MSILLNTDPDYNLWVLLNQARDTIFKVRERELSKHGITATEARVRFCIRSIDGEVTPAQIARWMSREHHTVTALLDRMKKRN